MFENIGSFFRRIVKPEQKELGSKDAAKERLHLVLMQDRANVSSEFLELMKQEILDVIKKYIIVDESQIDVRLTNQQNEDGTNGAPSLYANIPIVNIKNEMLVGKVKEFDSKTNSINFGEYKMVIETPSNVDEENIENVENVENIENVGNVETNTEEAVVIEENVVTSNTDVVIDELTEEEKQEVVEEIKEDIKEKIEEVKEALAEEQNKKENEEVIEETVEDVEEQEKIAEEEEKEEPVIIFNDDDDDDLDDDDDVTFDDLLKQAEEEDRKLAEAAKKEKSEASNVKVQHNNRNKSNKSKNNKRKGKK